MDKPGVTWLVDWKSPPVVTLSLPLLLDEERATGSVNFDIEIIFPGIVSLRVPSILMDPSGQLTDQFFADIRGYLGSEWAQRLQGFQFKREWLTPEILATAKLLYTTPQPGDPSMMLNMHIPDTLLDDIFASYPEHAEYSLRCMTYNYRDFEFKFVDAETGAYYCVTRPMAEVGFQLFAAEVLAGKLPGISVSAGSLLDPGSYDSYATDALLQCCLFGEVLYG